MFIHDKIGFIYACHEKRLELGRPGLPPKKNTLLRTPKEGILECPGK
jgi:hypothetical protein